MPSKHSSRAAAAPKAAFSASSIVSKSINSSVLKSAFAPTELRLSLFASTIRSVDSDQLRIHDTNTGDLKSTFTAPKTTINCIRWGRYGKSALDETPSKRSKRRKLNSSQAAAALDQTIVIAIGTSLPEIQLFSPLEGRVIATLEDSHARGTRDFAFEGLQKAWSLGRDSSLIYWDLSTGKKLRTLPAPTESLTRAISYSSGLLLASQSAYLFDTSTSDIQTIPCFDEPIHTLISQPTINSLPPLSFIAAAESKPTIGVYSTETLSITGNLNAGDNIRSIALFTDAESQSSLLASTTEAGTIELFDEPFQNWSAPGDDLKTKRKKMTRRSNAAIEVRRPDSSANIVPVINAAFDSEGSLILAFAEGSVDIGFEVVASLKKDNSLSISDTMVIKRAQATPLANVSMNGVKDLKHAHVDDSRAVVSYAAVENTMDDIPVNTLDDNLSTDEDSEEDDHMEDQAEQTTDLVVTNGVAESDTEMAEAGNEDADVAEEPTFGELVKARGIDTIKVSALDRMSGGIVSGQAQLSSISTLTLSTLVTQALNTNDSASLDTCLAQQDLQVVRGTIERLDSNLALTLLKSLAERLHSRPGRAGSLLVWVQWTIVAHGGYLSSRADVVQQLRSLRKVVQQRAQSLQPLLSLKGKLDMLDAQIALRKRLQQSQMVSDGPSSRLENMIYVEGQSESETDNDEEDSEQGLIEANEDEEEDEEEQAARLAVQDDDEEESDSEDTNDSNDSEASDDDQFDGEINHDDVDPMDSDDSADGLSVVESRQPNGIKSH